MSTSIPQTNRKQRHPKKIGCFESDRDAGDYISVLHLLVEESGDMVTVRMIIIRASKQFKIFSPFYSVEHFGCGAMS